MADAIIKGDEAIKTRKVTLGGTVAAKSVIENAGGIGIAMSSGVSGDSIIALIGGGPVELDKEAPLVITSGDIVYYDTTADEVDKTATNVGCGVAVEDAASAATRVVVHLHPGSDSA